MDDGEGSIVSLEDGLGLSMGDKPELTEETGDGKDSIDHLVKSPNKEGVQKKGGVPKGKSSGFIPGWDDMATEGDEVTPDWTLVESLGSVLKDHLD